MWLKNGCINLSGFLSIARLLVILFLSVSFCALISALQKDILVLQVLQSQSADTDLKLGFHPFEIAFPNANFPTAAVLEFLSLTSAHTFLNI